MSDRFKLIGTLAVPCHDEREWESWYKSADRVIARTRVGCLLVSTVFLGTDPHHDRPGDPQIFETAVFNDDLTMHTRRCSTWNEAEALHAEWVGHARTIVQNADLVATSWQTGHGPD